MNIVRKPTTTAATTNVRPTWDPFRMMREMTRWDPFGEMAMPMWAHEAPTFDPDFEVKETKEGYLFRADLPGLDKKDLEISMQGNRLTISGKREEEKKQEHEKTYIYERSYGAFTRSFTLPDGTDADKIAADLKDGVLTLLLPKKPGALPKKIDVKT